ncbi:MAG: EamA family transporter [Bacteroidetes bacterium HGW-Bacteroidetes-9]|jgi:drug/metabolite transporter (DMT)-like permease|nr:MAG: EamA family transporter [Bacteroidetes bacterium HGW-Bacteroidetes-9]
MKQSNKSIILALLAVLCWSTIGSAFKLTLNYLNFTQVLLFSTFVAVLFLGTVLMIKGKLKKVLNTPLRSIGSSAIMGLLNPFAYYLILLKAYSILQAQEAVALNYIWPMILVVLSAIFLKHRISWLNIFFLLISFSGTIVIATKGNLLSLEFSNPTGIALALSSAFFWAAYWLLNMKDHRETEEKLFVNFGFGFVYILVYSILTNNLIIPGPEASFGVIYIGLFEMGITFILWLNALKYAANTAKVSNLVYLSPFLSLMFVSIAVGEKILLSTIVGLLLIIGGILLQQLVAVRSRKKSKVFADGLQ